MISTQGSSNFEKFDNEWTQLGREICQAIYINPRAQELKNSLHSHGFLSLDEKSEFINLCDQIKYDLIFSKYGKEDTESYKQFSRQWQDWFQEKGVESQKNRGQRSSVDHILFGSTPDPVMFLLNFEGEMLGSMKKA